MLNIELTHLIEVPGPVAMTVAAGRLQCGPGSGGCGAHGEGLGLGNRYSVRCGGEI